MSSWARVGVKCVCVSQKGTLVLGREYTVLAIKPFEGLLYLTVDTPPDWLGESSYLPDRFRPLISQADDVAMFQKLVDTMKPTERLDALREMLDETGLLAFNPEPLKRVIERRNRS